MPAEEKAKIIAELKCVDQVFISIDEDTTQCKTLEYLKPHIFAKGGDRYAYEIPETPICRKHGIQIIDGVGAKIQSSSELVEKARSKIGN
jgi:bifunctional ADP-heptose synthase (sugar kinase/adenylyltransferase)